MILATASAAHGRDLLGQWFCVAIAAILYALIGWATVGVWGAGLGFALVPAYWLTFRRGKQENVENAYMDTTSNHVRPSLNKVLEAHYYIGWLTCLSLKIFNYDTALGQKLGWEQKYANEGKVHGKPVVVQEGHRIAQKDMPIWDCRRPTEFATGLTGDVLILIIILGLRQIS